MVSALLKRVLRVCEKVVVGVSALMIAVTFAQVVFRYAFGSPLTWSDELARYCFVWIVYFGAPVALYRGLHIGVDNLTIRLSPRAREFLETINNVLGLLFVLIVAYASLEVLDANRLQFSPSLGIQMSLVYLALPISMGVMALVLAARLLTGRHEPRQTE